MDPYLQQPAKQRSIGDVARATGLGVSQLRMWEQRYGQPKCLKLASGHRRYPSEEITRLRLVKLAIENGTRVADAVGADTSDLWSILASQTPRDVLWHAQYCQERWIHAICNWQPEKVVKDFDEMIQIKSIEVFLTAYLAPWVQRIGEGWQFGELTCANEHFASNLVQNYLGGKWLRANDFYGGPAFVLATLPNECHALGLHMCASLISACGYRIIFLGAMSPLADTLSAIKENHCLGLCISIAQSYNQDTAAKELTRLRGGLPSMVPMVIGGAGAPLGLPGIQHLPSLSEFKKWLDTRQMFYRVSERTA